jgi:hypothetical protein
MGRDRTHAAVATLGGINSMQADSDRSATELYVNGVTVDDLGDGSNKNRHRFLR